MRFLSLIVIDKKRVVSFLIPKHRACMWYLHTVVKAQDPA